MASRYESQLRSLDAGVRRNCRGNLLEGFGRGFSNTDVHVLEQLAEWRQCRLGVWSHSLRQDISRRLFTYDFVSVWLDTCSLGADAHPTRPIDYCENTQAAIRAVRDYAIQEPLDHATLSNTRWGLSAAEGPFDDYFAEAAPLEALAADATCLGANSMALEAEARSGDGAIMQRGAASGARTVLLHAGESRTLSFDFDGTPRNLSRCWRRVAAHGFAWACDEYINRRAFGGASCFRARLPARRERMAR